MHNLTRAHIIVHGRVQGVYYRGSTQKQALALGLTGWVRNLPDGTVEAEAQGPRPAVQALVTWCHQGPPAAQVSEVVTESVSMVADETGFELRR